MSVVEHDGKLYGLGAAHRAVDPREFAFRLTPPPTVDLDGTSSLAAYLSRIEDQLSIGSCVANAVTSAAELLAKIAGLTPPELDRLWLYARSRQKEATFPRDAGSYPADALDLALRGLPPESAERLGYIADATYNPGPEVDAQATFKYVSAHHPFYVTDAGGLWAGGAAALDARKPIVVAMSWRREFFSPSDGVLPVLPNSDSVGGHCIYAYKRFKHRTLGRLWTCSNSWSEHWTDDGVKNVDPEARPGDFFLPEGLMTNGIVWEARAVSGIAVAPPPPPPPAPRRKIWVNLWTAAGTDWHIDTTQLGEVPDGGAWVQVMDARDGKETDHGFISIKA